MIAIVCFVAVIAVTLVVTALAARRTRQRSDLYAADGTLGALQNGLAIAGDFMSASALLGVTALFFTSGADAAFYMVPFLLGLVLIIVWLAGPLRELGRFTLGDVMAVRLGGRGPRLFAAVTTIVVSTAYLVAQTVGAGALLSVLLGLRFEVSAALVLLLVTIYVTVGGMTATSWVQIVKTMLLLLLIVSLVCLATWKAGGLGPLYKLATAGAANHSPFVFGGMKLSPFDSVSLVTGLILGTAGLPHVLIRVFTVPDGRTARQSMAIAGIIIGAVNIALFAVIGPATLAFVGRHPAFRDSAGKIIGGTNMVVVHLGRALGGEILFGITAAIAFATILAAVAGLSIAVASAVAHDLYRDNSGSRHSARHEIIMFRMATVATSLIAFGLALLCRDQNVAILVSMAFAIAASASFPIMLLTLHSRRLTGPGAVIGGAVGLLASVALVIAGPSIWQRALGHREALFPSDNPALITVPLAFLVAILMSLYGGAGQRSNSGTA